MIVMPDAIWIDEEAELAAAGQGFGDAGVDRRRHGISSRAHLLPETLSAANRGRGSDLVHRHSAARQSRTLDVRAHRAAGAQSDSRCAPGILEAVYLTTKRIMAPVFDTQIAAGCVGLKPQVGYAELVKTLLDVSIPKGQTRTDWSKRPLSRAQLEYAADDVLYLGEVAHRLSLRLRELGARALGPGGLPGARQPGTV